METSTKHIQETDNVDGSSCAICATSITKTFHLYEKPSDRIKQVILSYLCDLFGLVERILYRKVTVLSDVTFTVNKGQSFGIVGRNGAGKSTLLQLISGTLGPTSGSANVNGRVAALLELGSGFNPEFTGRENVYMNARIYGLSDEQIDQRYTEIISFADIGYFIDQPVKTYSSGMTLRLAFAVIAHVDADILIIDEALAVGDVFFTQKCMRFLRHFMESGTLLFVSHDISAVRALCDQVIWLEGGRVAALGSPKDVTERYLEAMFASKQGEHSQPTACEVSSVQGNRFDQRHELINGSTLRNDIQVFQFDPNSSSFGERNAKITDVRLCNRDGTPLSWCVGGEDVTLIIDALALDNLQSVIVGFFVKDSLGQTLLGDNTFLTYADNPIHARNGESLKTQFLFQMPRMPVGDYTVSTAIATGTQDDHIQQNWIHDAIAFQSVSSGVATGLVGVPMQHIEIIKDSSINA